MINININWGELLAGSCLEVGLPTREGDPAYIGGLDPGYASVMKSNVSSALQFVLT